MEHIPITDLDPSTVLTVGNDYLIHPLRIGDVKAVVKLDRIEDKVVVFVHEKSGLEIPVRMQLVYTDVEKDDIRWGNKKWHMLIRVVYSVDPRRALDIYEQDTIQN